MEPSTDAGTPPGGGEPATGHPIDPEFASLPLREFADTALQRARELGAEHADFRAERIRGQEIGLSDGHLETLMDADELGLAVRVVLDGTWGFAAAVDLTPQAAVRAAEEAIDVARVAAAMNTERIELAAEPGYGDVSWVSAYQVDPFGVSVTDKLALLSDWSGRLMSSPVVDHVERLAGPGAGVQVLRRRGDHGPAAAGAAAPGAHRGRGGAQRPVRDHAHTGPARRPGV